LIKDKVLGHYYQMEGIYYRVSPSSQKKNFWDIQAYKKYKCSYCGDEREEIEAEYRNVVWYEVDEITNELENKGFTQEREERGGERKNG
jgi:hypothetical protein